MRRCTFLLLWVLWLTASPLLAQSPPPSEIFRPASPGPYPAVVLLHGSGGPKGNRSWLTRTARDLAAHGYLVVVPTYCTSADSWRKVAYFPEYVRRVTACVGATASRGDVRRDRLYLVGFSLGGGVALQVASTDARVRAVVCLSGALHPGCSVTRMPPVLALHGERDTMVPLSWAKNMERSLRSAGRSCQLVVYPGAGHGFAGETDVASRTRMLRFLDSH